MTHCPHHADPVPAAVKGLCRACYMRQRRAAQSGRAGRQRTGVNYTFALKHADAWLDRFHAKIDRKAANGCHEWTGSKNNGGYGVMHVADKTLLAHRLAFAFAGGDCMAAVVMHSCDNPSCVNPAHLSAGTQKANVADMDAKGRRNVGVSGSHLRDRSVHPRARAVVTPSGGFPSASLAADALGMSARTVQRHCERRDNGFRYA